MMKPSHIGILTSGGDSPGMNAAIRAVVRAAAHFNIKTSGIYRGYRGMIDGDIQPLDPRSVARIISRGGTFLKSSRCLEFHEKEERLKAFEQLSTRGIDGLVVIGGDGTMRGAHVFSEEFSIPVIGLPGTIDNDIFGTDFTIGFDTAVNVAMECVDKIRDTASSHDRLFFIEVMGRDTGHIALRTAVASGAIAVMMPEEPMSVEELAIRLDALKEAGKTSSIVLVAEGNPLGDAHAISDMLLKQRSDYESRVTVLGHLQRGGSPTAADRVLASELGAFAVESLLDGKTAMMAGRIEGQLTLTSFTETVNQKAGLNENLYHIMGILSN